MYLKNSNKFIEEKRNFNKLDLSYNREDNLFKKEEFYDYEISVTIIILGNMYF